MATATNLQHEAHFDHEPHPQVRRFRKEFDASLLPDDVDLSYEWEAIRGIQVNHDWSRLGFSFGLFCAASLAAGVFVWVPFLNVVWAVVMVALLLALPVFGARAALFRFREGRAKEFRIEFRGERVEWQSNDDWFWKPVKDFFAL